MIFIKLINALWEELSKQEIVFDVYVNIHGKAGHFERYVMPKRAYDNAKSLGWDKKAYFDFKPLGDNKRQGGLYKVVHKTSDNKYMYYHTTAGIFSLPKYLDSKLPSQDYIMFGQRVPLDYGDKF